MIAQASARAAAAVGRIERVLVVVNKRAGGVRRRPQIVAELQRIVHGRGEVSATDHPEELPLALGRARAAGVDTIAICGGDGTNLSVLTAMANTWGGAAWPRIALLRGGTVNTAAGNLGSAWRATKQLASLLGARELRVKRQPLLRVNERVGFIFGTALVSKIMDEYYAGQTGPVGCAVLATRLVTSAVHGKGLVERMSAPMPIGLVVDGRDLGTLPITGLVASVVAAPAVGLRATHRACEDGGFHLVATDRTPAQLAPELGRLWFGLAVKSMRVDEVAKQATLVFGDEARYTLDGEMFSGDRLELSATQPVELVTPETP